MRCPAREFTAWAGLGWAELADICSCNIGIHYIHVDNAMPSRKPRTLESLHKAIPNHDPVIPAQAGIQASKPIPPIRIPAFPGMTRVSIKKHHKILPT
jgi:hypothetical protein